VVVCDEQPDRQFPRIVGPLRKGVNSPEDQPAVEVTSTLGREPRASSPSSALPIRTGGASTVPARKAFCMVETEKRHEERRVLGWRFEELVRAGYAEREAMVVADRPDVDLHRAIELIESGCPSKTAVRILI
jgi:hypothetical protein